MDINSVVYVKGMPAAAALTAADVVHISQSNIDYKISLQTLDAVINNYVHPVGSLIMFGKNGTVVGASGFNPNTLFPGQNWIRFNAGKSLRSANADADVTTSIGADTFPLTVANLPAHDHTGSSLVITANGNHNHTGTTTTTPNHVHVASTGAAGTHDHQDGMEAPGALYGRMGKGTNNTGTYARKYTSVAGEHTHTVGMNGAGAHSHTITTDNGGSLHGHTITGQTANSTGTGTAFNKIPASRFIACWLRTS